MAAASAGRLPGWDTLVLIVLCMVLARTVAMTANRWVDAKYDAQNPRTARRAIPAGNLSARFVMISTFVCSLGFIMATSGFWVIDENLWPLLLSPVVLAWLIGYSFTKRFTSMCHLFLGSALAISPLAAVIAIEPAFMAHGEPYLLALMVLCWVTGFDVIYALQDVEFDRATGLHSMPANLGVGPALRIGLALHVLSIVALVLLVWHSDQLGIASGIGILIVAGLLVLEHVLVWGSKTHHIHLAFFTMNGIISVLLGGLGIVDIVRSV